MKKKKKYVEIQKFDFFRKENGENVYFSSLNIYNSMGYVACTMFSMPSQYF